MKSKTTILVTGATGQAGTEVCVELAKLPEVEVRAAVHTAAKRELLPAGVTPVPFDVEDPATVTAAVQGAEKLFLLTPGGPAGPAATRVITEAAKQSGIRHIVKLSSLDPERQPQAPTDLWAQETEAMVRDTGIPYNFLRPTWFFQNFSKGYFTPLLMQRTLVLPFGDGRAGWLDSRDIAAMAAKLLTEDGREGEIYTPTGPRTVSLHEIAAAFSEVTGREVRYRSPSDEEWIAGQTAMGLPEEAARAALALVAKTRDGYATDITDHVERLTGRPPRSLEEFARDHAELLTSLVSGP
ncbi:MAG: SDR family oxidoreductase [Thermoanaerobaculia bacterium]